MSIIIYLFMFIIVSITLITIGGSLIQKKNIMAGFL